MRKANRSDITKDLTERIIRHTNPTNDTRIYAAKEVSFFIDKHIRVDYMVFKPLNNTQSGIDKGDFYCYEVKSSVEDFHSGHGLNFIGDYNYLVMPEDVYDVLSAKREIPWGVGVYVPDGKGLVSVAKARRVNRKYGLNEMLLMMFRSANRENYKLLKESEMADVQLIIKLPEEVWEYVKNGIPIGVSEYVKNGTPLPKGHGRLIDAKAYKQDIRKHYFDNELVIRSTEIALSNAPTIIEADTESEE